MGYRIPPMPPPKWLIDERIKNGARTIREIDPDFAKWVDEGRRMRQFQGICMAIAAVAMAVLVGIIVSR